VPTTSAFDTMSTRIRSLPGVMVPDAGVPGRTMGQ
jgi:hypothetical protein